MNKNIEAIYSLSQTQQGILFHSQMSPDDGVYVQQFKGTLCGSLNIDLFKKTWQEILSKHPILRTVFITEGLEEPLQVVGKKLVLPIEIIQLKSTAINEQIEQFMRNDQKRGFAMNSGPLMRLTLFVENNEMHHFVWTFHHILLDGWSTAALIGEITLLYESKVKSLPYNLPERRPFSDYIKWLNNKGMDGCEEFWKSYLKGFVAPISLPGQANLNNFNKSTHLRRDLDVDAIIKDRLLEFCRSQRITLNTLIQGAWALVLSQNTRQEDIMYGVVSAGRPSELIGVERMLGLFITTLPLRIRIDKNSKIKDFLADLQQSQVELREFEQTPLFEIQRWSDLESNVALFDSIVAFENYPDEFSNVEFQPSVKLVDVVTTEQTNYPINLLVVDNGNNMSLKLAYDSTRYSADTADSLLKQLIFIVKQLVSSPSARISEIPASSKSDYALIVDDWNSTLKEHAESKILHHLIDAELSGYKDTIVVEDDMEALTAGELLSSANRLANFLIKNDIRPGMTVGVCMERSTQLSVALLGILKSGAAFIPLDPDFPAVRLNSMLENADPHIIISHSSLIEKCRDSQCTKTWIAIDNLSGELLTFSAADPQVAVYSDSLAYILYTSGSTGQPKGVMNTHEAITNRLLWMRNKYQISRNDRILQKTPISFDVSVWELFLPFICAAKLYMARPGGHLDMSYLKNIINSQKITALHFVPSVLSLFLEEEMTDPLETLRHAFCSGEALSSDSVKAFKSLSKANIHNLYGPTEAAIDVSFWNCQNLEYKSIEPIGKPLDNTQLFIISQEYSLLPPGVAGELCIAGVQLARGYCRNSALTAEKFIPNSFSQEPGSRLYRTGDLCRWLPDGNIEFLGRIDSQIKINGLRIEPAEIEYQMEIHQAVKQAIVSPMKNNQGDNVLCAFYLPNISLKPESDDLAQIISAAAPLSTNVKYASNLNNASTASSLYTETIKNNLQLLAAKRVLQLNVTSAHFLNELIETSSSYWAVVDNDSAVALKDNLASLGPHNTRKFTLFNTSKNELDSIPDNAFDLIVIERTSEIYNSDKNLVRALEFATRKLVEGGSIYLTGIFHLSYKKQVLQSEIEITPSSGRLTDKELEQLSTQDHRLWAEPSFFKQLCRIVPELSGATALINESSNDYELSTHCYDVILSKGNVKDYSRGSLTLSMEKYLNRTQEFNANIESSKYHTLVINSISASQFRQYALISEEMERVAVSNAESAKKSIILESEYQTWYLELKELARKCSYHCFIHYSFTKDLTLSVQLTRKKSLLSVEHFKPIETVSAATDSPFWAIQSSMLNKDIQNFIGDKMPRWMQPKIIIPVKQFALTQSGKVNRTKLPNPLLIQAVNYSENIIASNSIEITLQQIWSEVLDNPQIAITDNFFSLGGDSIRAIRIQSKARKENIHFPLQALFNSANIVELAEMVQSEPAPIESEVAPAPYSLIVKADKDRMEKHIEDAFPLSKLQAGMLFHSEIAPDSNVYHDVFSSQIKTEMKVTLLHRAVYALTQRHSILRTSFELSNFSQPLQLVHKNATPTLELIDLSKLTRVTHEEALSEWLEVEKSTKYNWQHPGLFRITLHHLDSNHYQFTISFHHSILDGWSVATMLTELFQLYFSELDDSRKVPISIAPEGGQNMLVSLESKALESKASREFWQSWIDSSEFLRLPKDVDDNTPSSVDNFSLPVPSSLSKELFDLAKDCRVPIKTLLLAAHIKVLSITSGSNKVTTGIVGNNRPESEDSDRLLGLFLSNLPLTTEVANLDAKSFIQEVYQLELQIYEHRYFPTAELIRMNDGHPLYQTSFNFVHFHVYEAISQLDHIEYISGEFVQETDLALLTNFSQDINTNDLRLTLDYDSGQLSSSLIKTIANRYLLVLKKLVSNEFKTANFLAPDEIEHINKDWNATATDYPDKNKTLHEIIVNQCQQTPGAISVISENGMLTCSQLLTQSEQLARELISQGVTPHSIVAVCCDRSLEMVVALLAILRAGAAYLPLDPELPNQRLNYMLNDCQSVLLLVTPKLESLFTQSETPKKLLQPQLIDTVDNRLPALPTVTSQAAVYVIYTSGSTGQPKGVLLPHYGVVNRIQWMQETFPLTSADRVLQKTPYSFDVSVWEFFWPLMMGAQLVIAKPQGHRDPLYLAELIDERSITSMHFVPSMLSAFLQAEPSTPLKSLRQVFSSGEALMSDQVKQFYDKYDASLHNLYGPTEASIDVSYWTCPKKNTFSSVPIGKPIANTELYVLDPFMQQLPVGAIGELYIGGLGLAYGYVGQAVLSAESFLPNPFSDRSGQRLYRTGDRVRYQTDGTIEYLGRMDDQVKIRGYRIELKEICKTINEFPSIENSFVTLVGKENPQLVAALIAPSKSFNHEDLGSFLSENLPRFMIPSQIKFVDKFPKLSNGKMNEKALKALLSDAEPLKRRKYISPTSPCEKLIVSIWQDILDVNPIGITDNFFEVGGHSLNAIQIITRLRDFYQTDIPLKTLFENPSIEGVIDSLVDIWGNRETVEEISEVALEVMQLSDSQVGEFLEENNTNVELI